MNYLKIHNSIIERAKLRILSKDTYAERHHIIPRCMGGNNDPSNLVKLLPEEHFLIHQLLVKIYPNVNGLAKAVNRFVYGIGGKKINAKMYGWLRKKYSEECSKKMKGENHPLWGTHQSKESKRKNSESNKKTRKELGKIIFSFESIKNIRKNQPASKAIFCLNNHIYYPSRSDAARQLNISSQNIRLVLRNKLKTTGGYSFRYTSQEEICYNQRKVA